jgi:hypothetical protein
MGGILVKPEKKKEVDLEKGENKDPDEEMLVFYSKHKKKYKSKSNMILYTKEIDLELGLKKNGYVECISHKIHSQIHPRIPIILGSCYLSTQ